METETPKEDEQKTGSSDAEVPNADEPETAVSDSDWENRILCSDGNCIGVIGLDGHCKECGKKFEGTLPETFTGADEGVSEGEDEPGDGAEIDDQPEAAADAADHGETVGDDWANRRLCSDGNCIGVIGPDGRCKECGKPPE